MILDIVEKAVMDILLLLKLLLVIFIKIHL